MFRHNQSPSRRVHSQNRPLACSLLTGRDVPVAREPPGGCGIGGVGRILTAVLVACGMIAAWRSARPYPDAQMIFALNNRDDAAALRIIDHGVPPNRLYCKRWTVLNQACLMDSPRLAMGMLDRGADPNLASDVGWTPLMGAATNGRADIVRGLLWRGATVGSVNAGGTTALHLAAYRGYEPIVCVLLRAGADVNAGGGDQQGTALQQVADCGQLHMVWLLLSAGASVDAADARGTTPLMAASARGHVETVAALLACGADPGCTDFRGRTAADFAAQATADQATAAAQGDVH